MKTPLNRATLLFGFLTLLAGQTATASIINGDFATGDFTGWTVSAEDDLGNPLVPDPFISVAPFGGGNAAQFETGEFVDGLFVATLEQTFTVSAAEPLLSFEFTLPNSIPDPTGTGTSPFLDALVVSVESGVDTYELLLVDANGALADPFGTAPGAVSLGGPQVDPAYDFRFDADLSALAGGSVTLFLELISEDDGFQWATVDLSSVTLEPPKPTSVVVPEPSAVVVWSLLGLAVIGVVHGSRGYLHASLETP